MTAATLRERLGLVALVYAHRAGFALLAAIGPAMLATRASASWPGGDAALFEPGSILAVESQRLSQRSFSAVFSQSGAILAVGAISGALVLGALIEGFARPGKIGARDVAAGATRALGTVLLLGLAAFFAELLAGAAVGGAAAKGIDALHLGSTAEGAALVAATLLTLVLVAAVGVVRDLACTRAVLDAAGGDGVAPRVQGRKFRRAIAGAWDALGIRILGAYAWRAIATVAIVAAGVALGGRFASVLVHQLAIFGVVLVHASWIRACVVATEAGAAASFTPSSLGT